MPKRNSQRTVLGRRRHKQSQTRRIAFLLGAAVVCLLIALTRIIGNINNNPAEYVYGDIINIQRELPAAKPEKSVGGLSATVLSPACQNRYDSHAQRNNGHDLPREPPKVREDHLGIPPEFVHGHAISDRKPMSLLRYDTATDTVVQVPEHKIPLTNFPITNVSLICIPDGIVLDNGMAGPYNSHTDTITNVYQNKQWLVNADYAQQFIETKPQVINYINGPAGVPLLGIQLSANMGFTWNLFSGDTLLRLGLVYDALHSDDPLWQTAKIVVSGQPSDNGNLVLPTSPIIRHVFSKLNLTHRLVPNNGWIAKANHTLRFDLLAMPDVAPVALCGPNKFAPRPIFPRGVLRPIQTAFGLTETQPIRKYIVFCSRPNAGTRRVAATRKQEILKAIAEMLVEIGSSLEVVEWTFDLDRQGRYMEENLSILHQAQVVLGPHGANLWNAVFAPPGGLLIEFNTLQGEFLDHDCRTPGFNVANAAGLSFALVETNGFAYNQAEIWPEVKDTVEIIKAFLLGKVKS